MVSIVVSALSPTQAETLNVGLYDTEFPPLHFKEGDQRTGLAKDILSHLSKLTGHHFVYTYLPALRLEAKFQKGEIDIETFVNPIWYEKSEVPGLYSVPYGKSSDVVVFRKDKRFPVAKASDLKGKRVGMIRGYSYPGFMEAIAKGDIVREDSGTEMQLLEKLAKGRYDQIFIQKEMAQYVIKRNSTYQDLEVGDEISSIDVMLRIHPSKDYILSDINHALKTMINAGVIEEIYNQYR